MGTWSVTAFGNDDAVDWADELDEADDLTPLEQAITDVLATGDDYLEAPEAATALAAVEILARLLGSAGESNSYTETVDHWVARVGMQPSAALLAQAKQAIERILAADSELHELWQESDDYEEWLGEVNALRARLG